jgi:RNA polymerase subunit RPABC4/transcription elongation factor Spt4
MAKTCKKCNASINNKAFECPYCGGSKFEEEIIEMESKIIETKLEVKSDSNLDLYSSKLDSLIEMALSDGELTEKEKQVLYKRAEAEGIDLDEFEMILDSKLKNQQKKPQPPTIISTSNISENNTPLNPDRYVELDNLINIALTDGFISEMERETLINKGLTTGIPQGEISMILDAKVIEKQKSLAQVATPKSDKFGDVKKCPSCAAIVGAFQGICSDCGHEFTNIDAIGSVQNLYNELMRVEEEERNRKKDVPPADTNGIVGLVGAFKSISGQSAIQGSLDDGRRLNQKIIQRKIGVVSMFPVPNTKADILEFLSMAVSEGGKKIGGFFSSMSAEEKDYIKAWKAKAEQVVMKAKFSLKDDKKLLDEINEYAKKLDIKN